MNSEWIFRRILNEYFLRFCASGHEQDPGKVFTSFSPGFHLGIRPGIHLGILLSIRPGICPGIHSLRDVVHGWGP